MRLRIASTCRKVRFLLQKTSQTHISGRGQAIGEHPEVPDIQRTSEGFWKFIGECSSRYGTVPRAGERTEGRKDVGPGSDDRREDHEDKRHKHEPSYTTAKPHYFAVCLFASSVAGYVEAIIVYIQSE